MNKLKNLLLGTLIVGTIALTSCSAENSCSQQQGSSNLSCETQTEESSADTDFVFNFRTKIEKDADITEKLVPSLEYNDYILMEFISYKRPDELRRQIFNALIRIYDHHDMGMLDKPYDNPLDLKNKEIVIRTIHSSNETDENDEIQKSLTDLKTQKEMKTRAYGICYYISPNFPKKTLIAMSKVVRSNLWSNIKFNPEETKRRINENKKNVKPVKDT